MSFPIFSSIKFLLNKFKFSVLAFYQRNQSLLLKAKLEVCGKSSIFEDVFESKNTMNLYDGGKASSFKIFFVKFSNFSGSLT